jgi:hypothetical protein
MPLTRARVLLALLLLAAAGALAFTYFKYRKLSAFVVDQIGGQAAKKLGRQVRFSSVAYSPFKGIVLRDACLSRLPDFSKGEFFCAKKTVIRPRLRALLRNRVSFSSVVFEAPVLKVRERAGRWDFEDLLALLPETDKGLYLTWNASELALRGGRVEADLETSGLSLALEDLDLELGHYSSYGGNFGLEAAGLAKTVYKGKLVSAGFSLKTDSNFAYGGLSSAKGEFRARDISYGAMTLETLSADWDLGRRPGAAGAGERGQGRGGPRPGALLRRHGPYRSQNRGHRTEQFHRRLPARRFRPRREGHCPAHEFHGTGRGADHLRPAAQSRRQPEGRGRGQQAGDVGRRAAGRPPGKAAALVHADGQVQIGPGRRRKLAFKNIPGNRRVTCQRKSS